jgi:GPH family glycoside/pentoside/hexuronide:cation symporter
MTEVVERRLGLASKAAYGLGDLGFLLVWHGSALFLLYFYTDVLGIAPGLAGIIYLAAMIWDAVSDPVVAAWAERRAARRGRYTPIIAWAALPVGIGYMLIFLVPPLQGAWLAAWALFAHLAFRTAYTIASMPYNTLPVRLSTRARDRNALSGFRVAGAATGGILTAVLTPLIVQSARAQSMPEATGYLLAAVIIGLLCAALLFACSRSVKEPPSPVSDPGPPDYGGALFAMLRAATANRPLAWLLAVMVLGTIGHGFFTHTILYFLTHVLARPDGVTLILGTSALATIVAAPLWVILAARTSKKASLIVGLVMAATGYCLMGLSPAGSLTLPLIAVALAGGGGGAIPVMLWSMVPDSIEYGEFRTGERIEARTFGLTTFAQKSAVGLTALMAGGLLTLSGYAGGQSVDGEALGTIRAMVSWLPAGFMAAIALAVSRYPLTEARHRESVTKLAARKSKPV